MNKKMRFKKKEPILGGMMMTLSVVVCSISQNFAFSWGLSSTVSLGGEKGKNLFTSSHLPLVKK